MENILISTLGIREAQIHILSSLIKGYKELGFVPIEDLEQIRKDVTKGWRDKEMTEALNELEKKNGNI